MQLEYRWKDYSGETGILMLYSLPRDQNLGVPMPSARPSELVHRQPLPRTEVSIPQVKDTSSSLTRSPENDVAIGHQIRMQLHGVYVPDLWDAPAPDGATSFRKLRLRFHDLRSPRDTVSLKLPAVGPDDTPYSYHGDTLFLNGTAVNIPKYEIVRVSMPRAENPWHFKNYTFPFRGSPNPFYELRLSPKITGYCPGRCKFCHREHKFWLEPRTRHVSPTNPILERIEREHGESVYENIHRVEFISELFGREDLFLDALTEARNALAEHGYSRDREFNCCANEVRTPDGFARLRSILTPARYSYTLECFARREEAMGWYKGRPMTEVVQFLTDARAAGFAEIQVNYVAGLDSLDECVRGFKELAKGSYIDSVGLSTFTAFSPQQRALRHPDAWNPEYYETIAQALQDLKILAYHPESYDMRVPHSLYIERTTL